MSETREAALAHRSTVQRDLLAAVGRLDDPTGQDLRKTLAERYDDAVRNARVYRNLRRLEDLGLLTVDRSGRCNHYDLTEAGSRRLQEDARWRLQR